MKAIYNSSIIRVIKCYRLDPFQMTLQEGNVLFM